MRPWRYGWNFIGAVGVKSTYLGTVPIVDGDCGKTKWFFGHGEKEKRLFSSGAKLNDTGTRKTPPIGDIDKKSF